MLPGLDRRRSPPFPIGYPISFVDVQNTFFFPESYYCLVILKVAGVRQPLEMFCKQVLGGQELLDPLGIPNFEFIYQILIIALSYSQLISIKLILTFIQLLKKTHVNLNMILR